MVDIINGWRKTLIISPPNVNAHEDDGDKKNIPKSHTKHNSYEYDNIIHTELHRPQFV